MTRYFSVHEQLSISHRCTYKVAECRQIVCQANCEVFERLHYHLNPSVCLHTPLPERAAPSSCSKLQDSHVSTGLFLLEDTYWFEQIGMWLPNNLV